MVDSSERYQVPVGTQETPSMGKSVCIRSFREVIGEHLLLLTHLRPPSTPTNNPTRPTRYSEAAESNLQQLRYSFLFCTDTEWVLPP
jgi:hypothetical protein